MRTRIAIARLAAAVIAFGAAQAQAQLFVPAPPASLNIDTSIRSAAMGGAGAAVEWGEPDVWANPATLAGVRGLGWLAGRTKLAPRVSDENTLSSQRFLLGGGGLGISLMGRPISGLGKTRLELGTVLLTSPAGTDPDSPVEDTEGWGVGLSPLRLIDAVRGLTGARPRPLTAFGDFAIGYQRKRTLGEVVAGEPRDEAHTYDWGASGRLELSQWWSDDAPFRLVLSGGFAELNRRVPGSTLIGGTPTRFRRSGVALRLAPAPPADRAASPPALPWWRPGDVPTLALGIAYDHDLLRDDAPGTRRDIDHVGFEATLLRLLSLRMGYLENGAGDIHGVTYGAGVTLPVGPWGSVGYDFADVPLIPDAGRQLRHGVSLWLEPMLLWRRGH